MAMTEIDFSRDHCPDVRRFQLDASGTKATQVNIPSWARRVTLRIEAQQGFRVAFTSDNIHSDFIKLAGNALNELTWWDGYKAANGVTKIYVANLSSYPAANHVSVMVEGAE